VSASKPFLAEDQVVVKAPVDVVRRLVMDVAGWPQLHRPAVHAEHLDHNDDGDLIQHWSTVDHDTVYTWRERRQLHDGGARLSFVHEPAEPPFADLRGEWTFEPTADGAVTVRMCQRFALLEPSEAETTRQRERLRAINQEYLETLRYAAENHQELQRLTISFEDPLFVAGSIEDAYAYLYEADKWPERIPHVKALTLAEKTPNIQFFDMDTVTPDGSAHTTRSVRICLPNNKIVYKQTEPPKALDAHTGHWLFTPTPEGVIASARHTATIRPEGLDVLGPGTTVEDARRWLRRVLSANSMGNLRLTKEYAEQRAGL
jgi:C7-C12 aromatase (ARO/CYC)